MFLCLALLVQVTASDTLPQLRLVHRSGKVPRSVTAVFTDAPPKIDGKLDDPIWQRIAPEAGFRRDVPSDGNPAAQNTEVRIAYDRDALYIGARLYDDQPKLIFRRLNRRDSFSAFNDAFFVLLDSYHDHRTQFVLGVTASGERRDAVATNDGAGAFDIGWDPVWEAKTSIDSLGWVAEMRIPFSQLRFPQAAQQVWGIQLRRDIVRAGEAVDWQWSPKTEPGQVSKYGHLLGLKDIPAPKRLEFLPYVLGQSRLTQGLASGNPFDNGHVSSLTGGLDAKYGVTSDLTLNATINPDFGQVEADPSVLNLSAFETFFDEKRPFFVEGSNIFGFNGNFGTDRFFYSRRIGRTPSLSALGAARYVDEPVSTSILGAAKFSGRTSSGWSIGALDAVTGREYARLADVTDGPIRRVPIEPLSNYGVLRLKRDVAGGSSGYGFMGTLVNRDIDSTAFPSLRRSAAVGAVDFFHRWKQNNYQLSGLFGYSRIEGTTSSILDAQVSSARYYQRPDQHYMTLDPNRQSLMGWTSQLQLDKIGGLYTYSLGANTTSPGFELNDAGFQLGADRVRFMGQLNRNWPSPGKLARQAAAGIYATQPLTFDGTALAPIGSLFANIETHRFSSINLNVTYRAKGLDDRATRGGPLLQAPGSIATYVSYFLDGRKPVSGGVSFQQDNDGNGSKDYIVDLLVTTQLKNGHTFSLQPDYQHYQLANFYLATYADPTATETFGNRYLFAPLNQNVVSIKARFEFFFNPALSLQVYAQPFVATANFGAPSAFAKPRSYRFDAYGSNGSTLVVDPVTKHTTIDADGAGPAPSFDYDNPSFRIRSLKSNVVLRWEYRPGSTLFLVWNQNRFNQIADPRFRALRDLGGIFRDDMQNVLLIKANYYISF